MQDTNNQNTFNTASNKQYYQQPIRMQMCLITNDIAQLHNIIFYYMIIVYTLT